MESSSKFELDLREREAPVYEAEYAAQHGTWFTGVEVALIRTALRLGPDDILADFGCGTGRVTRALAPSCREVIAIDRSRRSLQVLEDRARHLGIANITTVEADLTEPLRLERRATKAMSVGVLQQIPSDEGRRIAIENMREILAPGGRCIVENEGFSLVRRVRGRPQTVSQANALYYHTFRSKEIWGLLEAARIKPLRCFGCGVLYWTRYPFAPRVLAQLDTWVSFLPGTHHVAKFMAILGARI